MDKYQKEIIVNQNGTRMDKNGAFQDVQTVTQLMNLNLPHISLTCKINLCNVGHTFFSNEMILYSFEF